MHLFLNILVSENVGWRGRAQEEGGCQVLCVITIISEANIFVY